MISGPSPFNPTFGARPPTLAGRSELIRAMRTDLLVVGPRGKGFTRVLKGDRGVGKTVLLDEIASQVCDPATAKAENRHPWVHVRYEAKQQEPLFPALTAEVLDAAQRPLGLVAKKIGAELQVSAGLPGIASISLTLTGSPLSRPSAGPIYELQKLLRLAGAVSKAHNRGLLITIDEAHVFPDDPTYQSLGAVIQVVTKREQLPIALFMAGLDEVEDRIHRAGATFFERSQWDDIDPIDDQESHRALLEPISAAGQRIDAAALDLLVATAAGYPYFLQVEGDAAWRRAAARAASAVELEDAQAGLEDARAEYARIFNWRWAELRPEEQVFLTALASGSEPATTGAVAKGMGKRSSTDVSRVRDRLLKKRLITAPRAGHLTFSLPEFADWVNGTHPVLGPAPKVRPAYSRGVTTRGGGGRSGLTG